MVVNHRSPSQLAPANMSAMQAAPNTPLAGSPHELITIKSKNGFACRRFTMSLREAQHFDSFYKKIETFHQLTVIPFVIYYMDADKFPLPINNNDNLAKAISAAKLFPKHLSHHSQHTPTSAHHGSSANQHFFNYNNNHLTQLNGHQHQHHQQHQQRGRLLEIFIQKKETCLQLHNGTLGPANGKNKKSFKSLILSNHDSTSSRPSISMPEDFRQVSSIIDADILPSTCRRVKIVKHGHSDKPLGFFIRDGYTYRRVNAQLEIVTGIFISRLVPGGLAESTGLLNVNDEVLEVNGIQVTHGKTLDQVTDMMVANSSNLIITIRPGKLNNLS